MGALEETHAKIGRDIDDALEQLVERQSKHEGRLQLLEKSDNADMAFLKEQLRDIKTVVDILLDMAKADEERHG